MLSSAEVAEALERAADDVQDSVRALSAPIILIDGRSGSGKSTLARELATRLTGTVLALDSVYPGWDGLSAGADQVIRHVLGPVSRGERGEWTRWDWAADAPAERHLVEPGAALIIEGVGIVTAESSSHADACVWLESPLTSRRSRALKRDGDAYAPHWERWAAQEVEHIRVNEPHRYATLIASVP